MGKAGNISNKLWSQTRMLTLLLQHSSGALPRYLDQKGKSKGYKRVKEEVKAALFAGDLNLYIGKTNGPRKELLELTRLRQNDRT